MQLRKKLTLDHKLAQPAFLSYAPSQSPPSLCFLVNKWLQTFFSAFSKQTAFALSSVQKELFVNFGFALDM